MGHFEFTTATNRIETLEPRQLLSLTPFTPTRTIPGGQFALAVADNGSFVIAYKTEPSRVMVSRFGVTGEQLGKPIDVGSLDNLTFQQSLDVAVDPDGDAVVVYDAAAGSLRLRLISRTGVVSKPIEFAHSDEPNLTQPSVSMTPKGDFYVGWDSNQQIRDPDLRIETSVNVRHYTATGAPAAKTVVINTRPDSTIDSVQNVHVSALSDGSGVMCAYENAGDGDTVVDPVFVSTSGSITRLPQTREASLNTFTAKSTSSYLFGVDYVNGLNDSRAMAQLGQSPQMRLGSEAPDRVSQAASADFLPDRGFVALYEDQPRQGLDPNAWPVLAVQYDKTGKQIGNPIELGKGQYPQTAYYYTQVGADANGFIVAAWRDPSEATIHYRRLATQDFAFTRGSELYLLGTPEDEILSVKKSGNQIIATRSKTSRSFDASEIHALTINAYGDDDDIINQTGLRATIQGGDGNDTITSAASVSLRIEGDDGNDQITVADNAAAHVYGGNGNDSLVGGAGTQIFYGDAGADTIRGGSGGDELFGGGGNDHLFGEGGSDELYGGTGNDLLDGGAGADYVVGNDGNDMILAADREADWLFGGRGSDTASVDKRLDVLDGIETVL